MLTFLRKCSGRVAAGVVLVVALGMAVAATSSGGDEPKPAATESARRADILPGPDRLLPGPANSVDDLILLERSSRSLPPIKASADEPTIARITARRLELTHYNQQKFDDAVSARFLERYLESLDNLRLHFLQSDVAEFERYRDRLDDLTRRGDTTPAREIFARFLQRLEQRVAYVAELLKNEKFEFSGEDRYQLDRRQAPFPKDLDEAHRLWRQHLRYEVLQEILNQKPPAAGKTAEATKPAEPRFTANGLPEAVVQTLTRRYARILRTLSGFDGADVFQLYLGALTHVYDPHSDYMGKATLENFAINMNLSLFGIGAVLQSEDGYCKVRELKPGPAMRSKRIKPGDRIVAVAQADGEPVDVVDMKLSKVVELVRGPKGSQVRLILIPVDATDPSERVEVTLTRDEIKLEDEEAKAKIIEDVDDRGQPLRLGIIDLPSFYASFDVGQRPNGSRSHPKSTTLDVARLLDKLAQEQVAGVILDLRRNGGGSLEEAIQLTGLFIRKGPVVQVRDSQSQVIVEKDEDDGMFYKGPLVVLTSRFSASASEILAGALQDYGRALLVGDSSTHGKGTVQSLVQLQSMLNYLDPQSTNDPGALKVTVRKFYRASGASTQLRGVVPDIVLPSVNNYAEVGESSLENPLPWDTIEPAPFETENRIGALLPELRRRSQERVSTDRDFSYVLEDIELYRKYLAEKSVSLNEQVRRKEKAETDARVEARKRERQGRSPATEKVYDITLKQVNLPGLPPPVTTPTDGPTAPAAAGSAEDGEPAEPETTAVDVTLKETKRILRDLVTLSRSETALAGTGSDAPNRN